MRQAPEVVASVAAFPWEMRPQGTGSEVILDKQSINRCEQIQRTTGKH